MSSYFVGSTQNWEEFLAAASYFRDISGEIRRSSKAERVSLSRQTRQIVASREALLKKFGEGFDAVNGTLRKGFDDVEQVISATNGSIQDLRASFDYNLALVLEQLQVQNRATMNILRELESIHQTLQNPLVTQAREFFRIGSERLRRGLLDKALEAFLSSLQKDDTNFLSQLIVGKLYLYGVNEEVNVINPRKAEKHLRQAARYAKAEMKLLPAASRFAGEALLHAAIACYAQINKQLRNGESKQATRSIKQAYDLATEAASLSPDISETHYHQAKFAALIGDRQSSVQSLEKAIVLDADYCLKVDDDRDFQFVREDVTDLFQKLRNRSAARIQRRWNQCEKFLTEWHFPSMESKSAKLEITALLAEARACLDRNTYFDNQDAIQLLDSAEQKFQSLLVHKAALHSLSIHVGRVTRLAFNGSQTFLASGGADKSIHLWHLMHNQVKHTLTGHGDIITGLTFSRDGRALATVDKRGCVKLWRVEDGVMIYELMPPGTPVHCISFSYDDKFLAVGTYDRNVLVWNTQDGTQYQQLGGHKSSVDTIVFSKNSKMLASGSPDNSAIIWDIESGEILHTIHGCSGLSNSIDFLNNDTQVISGSDDGSVKIFDLSDGLVTHALPPRPGAISWLALSPDCKLLATINYGKALQLWEIESGKLMHNLRPFSSGITSVEFSPDGTILASSDYQDRSVKLWNVQNGKLMHVIAGNLTCSGFSPDGTTFVTGDETGSLRFWGRMVKRYKAPVADQTEPQVTIRWDEISKPTDESDSEPRVFAQLPAASGTTANGEPGNGAIAGEPGDEALPREEELLSELEQLESTTTAEEIVVVNAEPVDTTQQEIDERIKAGKCWVCGGDVGVIARLAGIKLCYKHCFDI